MVLLVPGPLPEFLKEELKRQEMVLVCLVVLGALVDQVARLPQGLPVFLVFPLSLAIQENLLALPAPPDPVHRSQNQTKGV